MKCSPRTTTFGSRLGRMLRTYDWGSRITANRFWVERSIWWCFSMAIISNNLFRRSNEAFSTHSTKRALLCEPALARTKEVSHLMKLTQVSKSNTEWTLKATPALKLQRIIGAEIPFRVFIQIGPWSLDQYVPFGTPFVRIKKVGH